MTCIEAWSAPPVWGAAGGAAAMVAWGALSVTGVSPEPVTAIIVSGAGEDPVAAENGAGAKGAAVAASLAVWPLKAYKTTRHRQAAARVNILGEPLLFPRAVLFQALRVYRKGAFPARRYLRRRRTLLSSAAIRKNTGRNRDMS
jgi:hypothetical protein